MPAQCGGARCHQATAVTKAAMTAIPMTKAAMTAIAMTKAAMTTAATTKAATAVQANHPGHRPRRYCRLVPCSTAVPQSKHRHRHRHLLLQRPHLQ